MKGLKLEELWLEGNPLCNTFPDQSTYTRLVVTIVTLPGDACPLRDQSIPNSVHLKKVAALVLWEDLFFSVSLTSPEVFSSSNLLTSFLGLVSGSSLCF